MNSIAAILRVVFAPLIACMAGSAAVAQNLPPPTTRPAERIERSRPSVDAPLLGENSMYVPIPGPRPDPGRQTPATGWVRHDDPLGFTLRHPRGWKVSAVNQEYILIRSEDGGRLVVVWPFLLKQKATAEQRARDVPRLFAKLFPDARVEKMKQRTRRPDEVLASMSYAPGGKPGRAALLCSIHERSGMLYAFGAPAAEYETARNTFVAVLKSFSFTKPTVNVSPPAAGVPAIRYVRWQDPRENAFSIEVPAGWKVSGGMYRFAPVDVRACITMLSPDGLIRVAGGDSEIPTFSIPFSPYFPEGSDYSPGYGVTMKVRRYVPGLAFAKEYVQTKVARGCSDLTFTEARDRPDAAKAINEIHARLAATGIRVHLTTGEASFACKSAGRPMRGYYFAGTQSVTYPSAEGQGGIWQVQFLHGYIAPADKVATAQAVLDHGIRSIQINPQWAQMQQGITAAAGRIVSETHAYISKIINDSYWSRQATYDDLSRRWSNVILGQTDLVDPATGERFKAESGHNYYWRKDYTNTGAGTDTYTRPDIDFSPLVEW